MLLLSLSLEHRVDGDGDAAAAAAADDVLYYYAIYYM